MVAYLLAAKELVIEVHQSGQTELLANTLEHIHQMYSAVGYLGI